MSYSDWRSKLLQSVSYLWRRGNGEVAALMKAGYAESTDDGLVETPSMIETEIETVGVRSHTSCSESSCLTFCPGVFKIYFQNWQKRFDPMTTPA